MKRIALVDCNNFFVSCEILMNPKLIEKPVCVLSNNMGCVVSRSDMAKKIGVEMGAPYFLAKEKFPNCIFLKGNHHLYAEISQRVMDTIKKFSPCVEVCSIDEAFIDLTNMETSLKMNSSEIIRTIKNTIKKDVGIDVSIGLSTSKVLAKFASDKAKYKSNIYVDTVPKGLYKIDEDEILEELKNSKIEDISGIGKRLEKRLKTYFIKTPFDFISQSDLWIKRTMGIVGLNLKQELLGISLNPVSGEFTPPKSIQRSESLTCKTNNPNILKSELMKHSHRICKKLRALNLNGEILSVYLKKKNYEILAKKVVLPGPTNVEFEINSKILEIFDEIYNKNFEYRSTGIIISKLSNAFETQLNLFEQDKFKKQKTLSLAWDKLEKKFGKNTIHLGTNAL